MTDRPGVSSQQTEDKFEAMLNNANAARVIAQAVEGTIGPKGLDVMMVDRFGEVVITNDGVTILKLMEVSHPAAHMIINSARSQQNEVGDGTTTTTILAGALVAEGANQVLKGVPVTRVVEGIKQGIAACITWLDDISAPVSDLDNPALRSIARIAGRGDEELAGQIIEAARILGLETLADPDCRFAESIYSREGAANQVFKGVIINKQPVNREMPRQLESVSLLVIDDALAPEEVKPETLKTEAGFQYYLQSRETYQQNLAKIKEMGVKLVVVDRSIDDMAEEFLTDAGIMVLQRVSSREIDRLCRHTGARKIKRTGLNRDASVLLSYIGQAGRVLTDDKLEYTMVLDGRGNNAVAVMIGAATAEVVDERERMAKDAAAAVQSALRSGVVPGGGAVEVWLASCVEEMARQQQGMASYGLMCVKEALIRPFTCMAANAGFNPLEKLGDVTAVQSRSQSHTISFDPDSGQLRDMLEAGIVDPTQVKKHAVKAAGEVAAAILRIETIIKMKEVSSEHSQIID